MNKAKTIPINKPKQAGEVSIKSQIILIREKHRWECLKPDQVIYIKSDNQYVECFTKSDKKWLVRETLTGMEEKLRCAGFMRTHQSYLVNLNFVLRYEENDGEHWLELEDNIKISISRDYVHQVRQVLQQIALNGADD